ncbi:MAG: phosphate ABC transporter permease PstA [Actinomycetota bacterium]
MAEIRTAKADNASARLALRHAAENRFRLYGLVAVVMTLGFLGILLFNIVSKGWTAFQQTQVHLDIVFEADLVADGDWQAMIRKALMARLAPEAERPVRRELAGLVSSGAGEQLRRLVAADPGLVGTTRPAWLIASDQVDMLVKGKVGRAAGAEGNRLSERQTGWVNELQQVGDIRTAFNTTFFTNGDSREPEQAGILGALVGSAFTLGITLAICFPLGVASAIYLEEFAPKNRWTDLVEVNINNLAAVPSVVFGLLGLAVFLNFFHLPRSAPLVGGLVLALICLPTIIISGRAALKAVPPSIRQAALGLGASKLQTVTDHVLPLAMPGMLTGTILGMAHALGESAPLLMIGMVAFIVDVPTGPLDPATALPVQVYLWADSPERAFVEKTSAAIMILLGFLGLMNLAAILLRKKFERRW